jgi:hypothetical protein
MAGLLPFYPAILAERGDAKLVDAIGFSRVATTLRRHAAGTAGSGSNLLQQASDVAREVG